MVGVLLRVVEAENVREGEPTVTVGDVVSVFEVDTVAEGEVVVVAEPEVVTD